MSLVPFYDFERPFRLMEREMFHPDYFFNRQAFNEIFPRNFYDMEKFFQPWGYSHYRPWESFMKPMEELSAAMNQLAIKSGSVTSDDEKFQVNVDVQHFAPEEITVKVSDGSVLVEGKHEEKMDHHGYVSRQFQRKFTLPQGCLPDMVQSKLSSDGVLTVTAPKILPLPSIGEKIVPITQTGPVKKQVGFQS